MANAPAKKDEGGFLTAFPMLAIPVAVYNIVAMFHMFGSDANSAYNGLTHVLFTVPMPSAGTQWLVSIGDVVIFIGLIMLFFELLKSTRSDSVAIVNHSLSMILFIICLVEFLLLRPFGTSTFFLLTTMTLLDVLAGFIVTIITARRDLEFG
ncbi:membrane protein [Asticcacaulis sp. DW145]|jgi:hypothetical protein|uniref:Transmembrane protein n=1 Tax=Asticcacaulis currens TaxID=2984210 RepID=A0ABT5IFN1_9CAUL|nr:hypothetical protein [Asticcacaulis currens]MDC7694723.1 hypothetical protein [Asticcacaulis currens]BEV11149.1 membrane protein [Asticcacaulis sp. DW145]